MKLYNLSPTFEFLRSPVVFSDAGGYAWKGLNLLGVNPIRLYIGDGYLGTIGQI